MPRNKFALWANLRFGLPTTKLHLLAKLYFGLMPRNKLPLWANVRFGLPDTNLHFVRICVLGSCPEANLHFWQICALGCHRPIYTFGKVAFWADALKCICTVCEFVSWAARAKFTLLAHLCFGLTTLLFKKFNILRLLASVS